MSKEIMKYVIKIKADSLEKFIEFYGGSDYIVYGEKYACYSKKNEAKQYKSRKIAEKVANRIAEQCVNVWDTNVEEV